MGQIEWIGPDMFIAALYVSTANPSELLLQLGYLCMDRNLVDTNVDELPQPHSSQHEVKVAQHQSCFVPMPGPFHTIHLEYNEDYIYPRDMYSIVSYSFMNRSAIRSAPLIVVSGVVWV